LSGDRWVYSLSLNTRFAIWDCSWSLLKQDYHWLCGAGLGNQTQLDQCYPTAWVKYGVDPSQGIDPAFLENTTFNPHNEFLQAWLDTGILGVACLVVVIIFSITAAIRQKNYLYLAFLIFFFLCCLSESLLVRQKGIVFYAFFNALLFFQSVSLTSVRDNTDVRTPERA
jgi:O-antigen ligase